MAAATIGIIGVGLLLFSGYFEWLWMYYLGAFVAGFSMCMLNTVINPLLNMIGGGGNRGNQLIQLGGAMNSLAATFGPFILGTTFPSKEFQTEFFRNMQEWFHDTTWSISIDAADDTYAPFREDESLLDLRFGNFDDSFMCEGHDWYNRQSWRFFGEERYKTAPFGGEFSYYTDEDQEHALDPEGMHGMVFEDEVAYYHMTYINGNDQPSYQTPQRIKEASMSMGYKFTIRDYLIKDGVAAILVANTGVAPIYRDAYVALEGVRGEYNLRNLMPGEETWVEISSPDITSASVPEIACDHLVAGQKIEYNADVQ